MVSDHNGKRFFNRKYFHLLIETKDSLVKNNRVYLRYNKVLFELN